MTAAKYHTIEAARASGILATGGAVALAFCEDTVEIESTLSHLSRIGFATILAFVAPGVALADNPPPGTASVAWDPGQGIVEPLNTVITACPGRWIHYVFNAEYLFFPFCETRRVGEMLTFHAEERRAAMLTPVIDLYADDLAACPDGVSPDRAHLDRTGYYALARPDPADPGRMLDRQLDLYGGLRWRFEEHVPPDRRRIDRIGLFRARPGLTLRHDHTLSDPEMNTYACPWHHNLTAAICSFRAAKALRRNAGSRPHVTGFLWSNSVRFDWSSQQLLDLGMIEPGQWF